MAPPPARAMPWDIRSPTSSGGVTSIVERTASTIGADGAGERVADLDGADFDGLGQARREVAAANLDGPFVVQRVGGAGLHLDLLGGALADQQVMDLAGVGDDLLVHLVAGDADGGADDDAAEGDDGDLGGAAADVDDHAAGGFHDRAGRRRWRPPSAPR